MDQMISLLIQHLNLTWFAAGFLLISIEFIMPGLFIMFLGLGALVTGVFVTLFDFSIMLQLLVWVVLSFIFALAGGKFIKDLFPSFKTYEPTMENQGEGQLVEVIQKIEKNKKGGRIKFQGTDWNAICESDDIEKGEYAKIISRNNLTYNVMKPYSNEVAEYLDRLKKGQEEGME